MISIVACGPSGALWPGTGPSIGVNDYLKWGKQADSVIVVNSNFSHERMSLIRQHKGIFYSTLKFWAKEAHYKPIQTRKFSRSVETGVIYHSITSPFIAISLAFVQGHREIVLYGVDFVDHPIVKDYTLRREVEQYLRLIGLLEKHGTRVYLGVQSGVFKNLLKVKG